MLLLHKPGKIIITKNNYIASFLLSNYKNLFFKKFIFWEDYKVLNKLIESYVKQYRESTNANFDFILLGDHSYTKRHNLFFHFYFNYYSIRNDIIDNHYLVYGLLILNGEYNKIALVQVENRYLEDESGFYFHFERPLKTIETTLFDNINTNNNQSRNVKQYFINYNKTIKLIMQSMKKDNNKSRNKNKNIYLYSFTDDSIREGYDKFLNMICDNTNNYHDFSSEPVLYDRFYKVYYPQQYIFLVKNRMVFSFNDLNKTIINIKKFFILDDSRNIFIFDDLAAISKVLAFDDTFSYDLVTDKELLSIYNYKQVWNEINSNKNNVDKNIVYHNKDNWLIFSIFEKIENRYVEFRKEVKILYFKSVNGFFYNAQNKVYKKFSGLLIDFEFALVLEEDEHYLYVNEPKFEYILLSHGYYYHKAPSNLLNLILDEDIIGEINRFVKDNLFSKPFSVDVSEYLDTEISDILSEYRDIFIGPHKITIDLSNLKITADYLLNNTFVDMIEIEKQNMIYYLFSVIFKNDAIITKKETGNNIVIYQVKTYEEDLIYIKVQTNKTEDFYMIGENGADSETGETFTLRLSFALSKELWEEIKCGNISLNKIEGYFYIHNQYQYSYEQHISWDTYRVFLDFICTWQEHSTEWK
ncbi:MAG: hypothetical protein QXF12_01665 [Candidatus Aenigmatarchaeota archaeon]